MATKPLFQQYQTGVIVEDIEAAKEYWGVFGYDWAPVMTFTFPLKDRFGVVSDATLKATQAVQGPNYMELVEAVDPGAFGVVTGGPFTQHQGYFTDDVAAAVALLESKGFILEVNGVDDDGEIARVAFLRHPETPGYWVELCDSGVLLQGFDSWMRPATEALGLPYVSPADRAPFAATSA